jgi:hypothetical protein
MRSASSRKFPCSAIHHDVDAGEARQPRSYIDILIEALDPGDVGHETAGGIEVAAHANDGKSLRARARERSLPMKA